MTHRLLRLVLPELVWNQEIYGAWLQRFVSKDVRWLEAGCGWRILGEDLETVEDSLVAAAGMVVGTDLTIDSLARHRNIERRTCASIDCLPFADNSFDLVTCNMVIEHLPNPLAAFREITRVLSPSGVLILHTPNTLNYLIFLNRTVARVLPRRFVLWVIRATEDRRESDVFPTFYRANSLKRLREISRELNLIEVSSRVLTAPQPVCRFFAPLAFVELLLMRATMSRPCGRFGTTLLAAFRKDAAGESSVTPTLVMDGTGKGTHSFEHALGVNRAHTVADPS
jgi:ubiquinone/menaquinone biosynthesis C-methylase UbiE